MRFRKPKHKVPNHMDDLCLKPGKFSQSSPTVEGSAKKDKHVRQNSSGNLVENVMRQNSEKLNGNDRKKIRLGVCAMEKKTSCKPMKEILDRISAMGDIVVTIFPEHMILYMPVQEWPIVDCLIAFYSSGFPLAKAEAYIELRKPYMVNELKFQDALLWRHKVYDILVQHGIPVPKYYVVADEKIAKKSKKDLTASCPPESFDDPNSLQIHSIDFKGLLKDTDSTKGDPYDSKESSKRGSFFEKERPVITIQNLQEVNPPVDKEEEKSEGKEKSEQSFTTMSRQHSQSSLVKTGNVPEVKEGGHRRKYSEQLLQKSNKAESYNGDEFCNTEPYKQPMYNYHKKYYTKIEEHDDFMMIGDHKLTKPFVEKPLDAEDHQINIYYPKSDGGGCKSLFRKTNNVSSSFDPNANTIRRGKSFVYEEFLPTEGFDIKVYTVGPNYAHAEARKSPVLDGVVQRTKEGKEVRFPVNLTYEEKIIAKKIVFAFDQQVCGFDLLRSKGKSYVCDVNGWSFVKGNPKYYMDCAMLLRAMMLARFAPERLTPLHPIISQLTQHKSDKSGSEASKETAFRPELGDKPFDKEELRSVVTIFRHGDRTPKQKMKMITTDLRYLSLFDEHPDKRKEVKLKTIKQMQQVLDITQEIIEEFFTSRFTPNTEQTRDIFSKHLQLYSVLRKGGHFEGINRKIQLKPLEWETVEDPLTKETSEKVTKGLFILKWGGELTHSGTEQAEELGAVFRNQVYPQDNEGILRLHSTYRHDLKIYSSQEGRCQKTAAAFCKGLLELEGDLTPIMVSLVRKDEVAQELLEFNKTQESDMIHVLKTRLSQQMNSNEVLYDAVRDIIGEEAMDANMRKILRDIGRPYTLMKKTHDLVKTLASNIKQSLATDEDSYYLSLHDLGFDFPRIQDMNKPSKAKEPSKGEEPICEEVPILIYKRWKKLESDFYKVKEGIFDISKVPDIYYSIRYDVLHSKKLVESNKELCLELLECAKKLAYFVIPAEYGLTDKERIKASLPIVSGLLEKVTHDLVWWSSPFIKQAEQIIQDEQSFLEHKGLDPSKVGEDVKSIWRHVRTRLYFTSASHLYTLFNVISMGLRMFHPYSENYRILQRLTSLDYLSHVMIRLYENLNAKQEDPNRFRLEMMFSQGCKMDGTAFMKNGEHRVSISPSIVLNSQLTLGEVEEFLNGLLKLDSSTLDEKDKSKDKEKDNKEKEKEKDNIEKEDQKKTDKEKNEQ